MDMSDVQALLEMKAMCNRVKDVFIKEGFMNSEDDLIKVIEREISKASLYDQKGDLLRPGYIISFVDMIYEIRGYKPLFPKDGIKFLILEAYDRVKYAWHLTNQKTNMFN